MSDKKSIFQTIDEMEARGDFRPTPVGYKDGLGKFRNEIKQQEGFFSAHADRVAAERWKKLTPKEQEVYIFRRFQGR